LVNNEAKIGKENFQALDTGKPNNAKAEVQIPKPSVLEAHARFGFSLYGYFVGKRVAFSVVEYYVKNVWKKYGIVRVMMNAKGFFFFKFASIEGMNGVLENGLWFIRLIPIILKKWTPTSNLLKEDLNSVPIWVKLHDILIVAFTADGLSAMATKLGNPIMLDSYTSSMCLQSWGRMDYARALIDIRVDQELKEEMVIAIPNVEDDGEVLHSVRVEYEWKPPRCGPDIRADDEGFIEVKKKKSGGNNDGTKNFTVSVKPKTQYRPKAKQSFEGTSNSPKTTPFVGTNKASTSGYNKESPSNKGNTFSLSNSFEALNDENLIIEEVATGSMATTSGTQEEGQSSTPIVDKLIDDEVEPVDNEMTSFLASKSMGVGYGLKSLLEQWREDNVVDDYDPYDDDMYEGQEIPDNIQTICDNLDIKVRGRRRNRAFDVMWRHL
ncbi:zinc knuckle CX2CX4HX4C containing protein, partial [Tanacetum coccineum]